MFKGVLIKESLKDQSVLNLIRQTNVEVSNIDNATEDQPKTWTLISFEVSEAEAGDFAEKLKHSIDEGKWYVDFSNGEEIFVVFYEKLFRYRRDDAEAKKAVVEYARSIGIPENQLDWAS